MKMNVIDPNNNIVNTFEDDQYIIANLLSLLFNKVIVKSKHIKSIQYNYNYTNSQTLTLIFDNNYKHEYINIPVYGGLLDSGKIQELLKGGE